MNIDQAKAIALPELLLKLGHQPVRERGCDLWYLSPLRDEKTASFHINTTRNVWYDFGSDKGGDTVSFAQEYLRIGRDKVSIADSLHWLRTMHGVVSFIPRTFHAPTATAPALELKSLTKLALPQLYNYLDTRGIDRNLARRYYKQAQVFNTNTSKTFTAISFANEDGGHELRNAFFKGCIAPKRISFIRGATSPSAQIHIFEGSVDFLSTLVLARRQTPEHDTIVLNSLSCLRQALPYISSYGYTRLCAWLDNDQAGDTATLALQAMAAQEKIAFRDMRTIYKPHKDVNDFLMHRKAR
ncbi:MAG: toprim domain-containing protein [Bacteroidia bacterium]|jgi:hypothetical protein|nr:toprim domain-containing protein [Bacteroidia bacterium]